MFAEVMFNFFALKRWRANPAATKREIGLLSSWKEDRPENHLPLSRAEVAKMKEFLRRHAPSMYRGLFRD